MNTWTPRQRESFIIHTVVVAVPFFAGTASAWLLWQSLFNSPWIASVLVGVIEALALIGFVLHIRGTPSPFVGLRHLLPFISFVPLAWEAYQQLDHNGMWVAGLGTAVVTAWLIYVAFQCYGTIERLFDPETSARQQAEEGTRALLAEGQRAMVTNDIIGGFVADWQERQLQALPPPVTYARPVAVTSETVTVVDGTPDVTQSDTDDTPACVSETVVDDTPDTDSATKRVKAYAAREGVSISTAWRRQRKNPDTFDMTQEVVQ